MFEPRVVETYGVPMIPYNKVKYLYTYSGHAIAHEVVLAKTNKNLDYVKCY